MRRILLVLTLSVTLSACYQYLTVPEAAPLPARGTEVRVRFSPPRSVELGTITVHDINVIEGHVYRTLSDTIAVSSRQLRTAFGGKHYTNGAVFYIAQGEISQLEQRRLAPAKTGLAAGTAAVALVALLEFALRGGGAIGEDGPPIDQPHIGPPPPAAGIRVGRN